MGHEDHEAFGFFFVNFVSLVADRRVFRSDHGRLVAPPSPALMNDRSPSTPKMPDKSTMVTCDATARADRKPMGLRNSDISASKKPTVPSSDAMCIACLRECSECAMNPRRSSGTPKIAGINAVRLLVPVRRYPASPSSVSSSPNTIVVEAMD